MNSIQKNINNALELDNLPAEEQQEIMLRIGTLIYQNILIRVMEIITDEDQDEFEKLLDSNKKPEEIFSFLKNKVQDFEKIIAEEALKFKNKSDNIMSQIGN